MQKIAIIGNAGSGKTTLARALHQKLQLPLYHLDQYYFLPNWQRSCYDKFTALHADLCSQPVWIIEGCNLKLIRTRVESSDTVIFLDMPRWLCIWRVLYRFIAGFGTVTSGHPRGCEQRFTAEFFKLLRWVWHFNTRHRESIYALLKDVEGSKKIYILKSVQEIEEFLGSL